MCLGRLAFIVRAYLEEAQGPATLWNVYRAVGIMQLKQRWQEETLFTPLKRRICEVLRVMEGVNLIYA